MQIIISAQEDVAFHIQVIETVLTTWKPKMAWTDLTKLLQYHYDLFSAF